MSKTMRFAAVLITAVMVLGFGLNCFALAETADIYVSVNGNDETGDGSQSAPFATLGKARDYIRTLSKDSDITVNIGAGEYYVNSSVSFSSQDSGNENCTVTYKAADGAVFKNTKKINTDEFKKVTNPEILKKLKKEVRADVYALELGLYCTPSIKTALILDGERLEFSRYPKDTFLTANNSDADKTFSVADNKINEWAKSDDMFIKGALFSTYSWGNADITDISDSVVTVSKNVRNNAKIYFNNVLEEMSAVGEYVIDIGSKVMYCILPDDYKTKTAEITAGSLNSPFINLNGAEYIKFDGLNFYGLSNNAVHMTNCKNISVENCSFNFINADYAIRIVTGKNINVYSNGAYKCSGGFVRFSGGNRVTLENGNINIEKNVILNCATDLNSCIISSGVNSPTDTVDAIGNTVKNNIIGDSSPTNAISAVGIYNKVSNNEIYNVSRQIDDGGAIYYGRSNTKYGNDISYNYIHHLNKAHMFSALYADDGYGGINMHHNVMYNMSHPIHIGMGMNNSFNNNMYIDVDKGIRAQTRMTWGDAYANFGDLYQETYNLMEKTIMKELYAAAFPDLKVSVTRKPFFAPYNSQITGNVSFGNVNALYEVPTHLYYSDETAQILTISDEANVTGIENALSTNVNNSRTYVNELKAYGAKITASDGTDLNGTTAGNPRFDYSSSYFKNASAQDFTLTSAFSSSVSTVNEINMSEIGNITASENKLLKPAEKINVYVSENGKKLDIAYGTNASAAQYRILAATDSGFSNIVFDKTVYEDNMAFTAETDELPYGTYYIKAIGTGLSKQSQFTVQSDVITFTHEDKTEKAYKNAFTLLEDEIKKAQSGDYVYSDESIITELETKHTYLIENDASISKADEETAIYDLLIRAQALRKANKPEIIRCEADSSGDNVYVTASGFHANSLVTVLVTNPNTDKDTFANGNKDIVRYTNVLSTDNNGCVSFDFDTKINDIDYLGTYTVYLADANGRIISQTYDYGTVETSAITFYKDSAEISAEELSAHKGETLTAKLNVNNRISIDTNAYASIGSYKSGKLIDITFDKVTLLKNSVNEVTISFKVPDAFDENTTAEFMLLDGKTVLKPLSLKRIIKEIE